MLFAVSVNKTWSNKGDDRKLRILNNEVITAIDASTEQNTGSQYQDPFTGEYHTCGANYSFKWVNGTAVRGGWLNDKWGIRFGMYPDRDERIERQGSDSPPLHITSQHEWYRVDAKFLQVAFSMIAKEPLNKGESLTCHMSTIDLYENCGECNSNLSYR